MQQPIDFEEAKRRLESATKVRCAHCGRWIPMQSSRCHYCGVNFEGAAMQFIHPGEHAEATNALMHRRRIAVILFAIAAATAVAISALAGNR